MAENSTDYPLVLPSWDQLNFSRNCTAYGQWLYSFLTINSWDKQATLGGSITLSLELFGAAVPPDWSFLQNASAAQTATSDGLAAATTRYYGRVLQWYTTNLFWAYNTTEAVWNLSPDFSERVIWLPAVACPQHFCKAVAFTGNSDLSGIGVLISYLIEATLVTSYLACFTLARAHRAASRRHRRPKHPNYPRQKPALVHVAARRLFDAVRGSLVGFLTSATIFALSILTAAVVMAAKQAGDNRSRQIGSQTFPTGSALYNPVLALLVGLFAVFPVAVLHLLVPEHDDADADINAAVVPLHLRAFASLSHSIAGHRSGSRACLRRVMLALLWGLAIAMVVVSPHSELDYAYRGISSPGDEDDDNTFSDVLYACDARGGLTYWHVLDALLYLVVGAPLLWLFLTAVLHHLTRRRPQSSASPESPLRVLWIFTAAWICCAIMWAILLSFVSLRADIVETAGSMDTDDEWAFGQVLAIATWAPVVSDLVYLFVFGLEAGLAGHLPDGYTVRRIAAAALGRQVRPAGKPWKQRQPVSLSTPSPPRSQPDATTPSHISTADTSAQQTSAESTVRSPSGSLLRQPKDAEKYS